MDSDCGGVSFSCTVHTDSQNHGLLRQLSVLVLEL